MKITSSNSYFENLMSWAQKKTHQFVMTGLNGPVNKGDDNKWYGPAERFSDKSRKRQSPDKPWAQPKPYIPSYWAGYYDRTAFYIRDFVHQAPGAEFLGYHEENYQMLKSFVSLADKKYGWYAPWSLNFDGSIYYMDTPNNRRFVRELISQYELAETICVLYFMTGDERYLASDFQNYIEHILNDFTKSRDGVVFTEKNGIPEGVGNIWKGSASYNESGLFFAETGDCIAAMYRALDVYANLLKETGKYDEANGYFNRAASLKNYFNNEWSIVPESQDFAFAIDKNGKKYHKWLKTVKGIVGAETCFIMPIKLLTEPGERNELLLEEIDRRAKDKNTCMKNIESYAYLPQVFFPYNQPERAWYWMKYIGDRLDSTHVHASQGTNGDYPEISFTLISSALQGLLGLSANSVSGIVYTCPCLPREIPDITAENIKIGGFLLNITVVNKNTVCLTNCSEKALIWNCAFYENASKLYINGLEIKCNQKITNGVLRSFTEIRINQNMTVTVVCKQ